jgi:hypothetical protein
MHARATWLRRYSMWLCACSTGTCLALVDPWLLEMACQEGHRCHIVWWGQPAAATWLSLAGPQLGAHCCSTGMPAARKRTPDEADKAGLGCLLHAITFFAPILTWLLGGALSKDSSVLWAGMQALCTLCSAGQLLQVNSSSCCIMHRSAGTVGRLESSLVACVKGLVLAVWSPSRVTVQPGRVTSATAVLQAGRESRRESKPMQHRGPWLLHLVKLRPILSIKKVGVQGTVQGRFANRMQFC